MPAHVKKWLIIAVAVIVILKFRNQLAAAVAKVPVVGTFIG